MFLNDGQTDVTASGCSGPQLAGHMTGKQTRFSDSDGRKDSTPSSQMPKAVGMALGSSRLLLVCLEGARKHSSEYTCGINIGGKHSMLGELNAALTLYAAPFYRFPHLLPHLHLLSWYIWRPWQPTILLVIVFDLGPTG